MPVPFFMYNQNIPLATNNPSVDQPNMETNTNSIAGIIAVDHVGFGTNNGGYHTDIHMVPQGSDPANIPGFGQLYAKTISGDQQLFFQSGAGVISELTPEPLPPSTGTNGYVYLPGGVLLQWGQVSFVGSGQQIGQVLFVTSNIDFPNACLNVQTTLHPASPPTGNTQNVSVYSTQSVSFRWNYTGSSAYDKFYWFAIGF